MKRLILLAGSMLAMLQVTAQELPGSIFVTLGVGASSQRDDHDNTSKTLQVAPSINFLINERWSLGLFVEHGRSKLNTKMMSAPGSGYYVSYQEVESKYRSLALGPQVRYYQPVAPKLFFISEAQAGLEFERQEIEQSYSSYYNNGGTPPMTSGESSYKASALSMKVNVSPGLVYFIKPKFGLELKTNLISYNHGIKNSMLPQEAAASRDFKLDLSLARTSFGASFYF
jgi:hypothetical protein